MKREGINIIVGKKRHGIRYVDNQIVERLTGSLNFKKNFNIKIIYYHLCSLIKHFQYRSLR